MKRTKHRRRREKKTDFKQRLKLLKSGEKRLVVRKHLNNTRAQLVDWNKDGDETLIQVDGEQLRDMGWEGHLGNLPSAYLIGYMLGLKAKKGGIKRAVLDMGLQESTPENRIYAVVKGSRDAGLEVPVDEAMIPSENRYKGGHIEEHASNMSKDDREEQFSKLIERGLDPKNITKHFEEIKEKIEEEIGE